MFGEIFGQGLPNKVSIYIPSTVNVAEKADGQLIWQWVMDTHKFLATQFGGATSHLALGSYIADSGILVTENVTIVYAYADTLTRAHLNAIKAHALALKRSLGQEAIAVEINGSLFFT